MKKVLRWSREWLHQQREARQRYNEFYERRLIYMPKYRWHTCTVCNGTGSYLESGDAHRSEGWVPCTACDNGTAKKEWATFERSTGIQVDDELAYMESGLE